MKQYKLIKKFPNSPELGTIVTKDYFSSDKTFSFYKSGNFYYRVDLIEDYPEFWEELEDYEILSFLNSFTNHIKSVCRKFDAKIFTVGDKVKSISGRTGKISKFYLNGTRPRVLVNDYIEQLDNVEKVVKDYKILEVKSCYSGDVLYFDSAMTIGEGLYVIYQILRISDGEIFTVGDKVKSEVGEDSIIYTFNSDQNGLIIKHTHSYLLDKKHPETEYGYHLHLIEKVKKPIFITEDGVKCFNDHCNLFSVLIKGSWETRRTLPSQAKNYPNWKHFHTKEARDEYILNNKPALSVNDIIYWIEHDKFYSQNQVAMDCLVERLKRTVKSKL